MDIRDYAFLSDCQSAALVGRNGSIDWLCLPRFDSPSVFARLLDPGAGHWRLAPAGPEGGQAGQGPEVQRDYLSDSLVLRSVFKTVSGTVEVTDALALTPGSRGHEIGMEVPHALLRLVRGMEGRVGMEMDLRPRLDYGRLIPSFNLEGGRYLMLAGDGPGLIIEAPPGLEVVNDGQGIAARFRVSPGETAGFRLMMAAGRDAQAQSLSRAEGRELTVQEAIDETTQAWRSLGAEHKTYDGLYPDEVRRSAFVLQGLTYQPSGAVVAAATTSLPEVMGGRANWDYRYSWLRDASLMMRALWVAACPDEPERFFEWINRASARDEPSKRKREGDVGEVQPPSRREAFQIMYGVEGERDLSEQELSHLAGFAASRPVRVGNDAWMQKQLDVPGEVIDAAHILRERLGELSGPVRELLVTFADYAAQSWMEPDSGMWEARDQERHYTSSKVMCWVALDRAIEMIDRLGAPEKRESWERARREVREAILERAWSERAGAYSGAFGSDGLDAAVLLMPLVDFLPATDERMLMTIEAIDRRFCRDGLVKRWEEEENGFLLCSYWLVECLALAGRRERAREIFEQVTGMANDLGLLSEMASPVTGELLGNFPQAFSHVGLINAAWRLTLAFGGEEGVEPQEFP